MDCFGTHSTHVQTCDYVRVQRAMEWTIPVHTLHMSKPVIAFVFQVPKLLHVDFSLSFMFEITRTRCYVMSHLLLCVHMGHSLSRQVHIRFNNSKGTFIKIYGLLPGWRNWGEFPARCVLLEKEKESGSSRLHRVEIHSHLWTQELRERKESEPENTGRIPARHVFPRKHKNARKMNPRNPPRTESVLTVYIMDINTLFTLGSTCEKMRADRGSEGTRRKRRKDKKNTTATTTRTKTSTKRIRRTRTRSWKKEEEKEVAPA